MSLRPSPSLFEPTGAQPLGEASAWLTGTLLGDLATGVCVIAIAVVGLMMMGGRLPVREGLRVVIGCFILLGAPTIAGGLMREDGANEGYTSLAIPESSSDPRGELPPSDYNPYAGASLRRN